LPGLSKARAAEDWASYNQTLDTALRLIVLLGVPATLGLVVLAEPLMLTLFAYDAFTVRDAHLAAQALTAYGVGLLGLLAVKVLAPAFYAREQMKTPVKISVVALVVNLALALLLIEPWAHIGLAVAVSVAALVNAGLLWWFLRHHQFYVPEKGWWLFGVRVVVSGLVMLGLLWWLMSWLLTDWAQASGLARSLALLALVVAGVAVYGISLVVLGLRRRHFASEKGEAT